MTAVESIIAKIKSVKPTQFCSIETILEWCEEAREMENRLQEEEYERGYDRGHTDGYGEGYHEGLYDSENK